MDRRGHKSQPPVGEHDHIFKKEEQENVDSVPDVPLLVQESPTCRPQGRTRGGKRTIQVTLFCDLICGAPVPMLSAYYLGV